MIKIKFLACGTTAAPIYIPNTKNEIKLQWIPGAAYQFVRIYTCAKGYSTLPGKAESARCVLGTLEYDGDFICFKS